MKEIVICLGTSASGKTTFAKTQKKYEYFHSDEYFLHGVGSFTAGLASFVEKNDKIIIDGWLLRDELTNSIKELEKKHGLKYFFYITVRDVRVISKIYQERPAHRFISPGKQCEMIYECIDYVINYHGSKGVILQVLKEGYHIHSLHISRSLLNKILYSERNWMES